MAALSLGVSGGGSADPYSDNYHYQGLGKYKKSNQWQPMFSDQWQPMFSGGTYNPTNSTTGAGGTTDSYLSDMWDKWNAAYESPGYSKETIDAMKNAAQTSAQSGWDDQTQKLQNRMTSSGLSGSGFADAQLAALQNKQWGGLQDVLGNVDIEAANAANQNKMTLLGQGMGLASTQAQLAQNAYDAQLARDQFAYQQYQDYLDRKAAASDRSSARSLYDLLLSQYMG